MFTKHKKKSLEINSELNAIFSVCPAQISLSNTCQKVDGHCSNAAKDCPEGYEKLEGRRTCNSKTCACCYVPCTDEGCAAVGGTLANHKKECHKKGKKSNQALASGHRGCTCCEEWVMPVGEEHMIALLTPQCFQIPLTPRMFPVWDFVVGIFARKALLNSGRVLSTLSW